MSTLNAAKTMSLLATICTSLAALAMPAAAANADPAATAVLDSARSSEHTDDCDQYAKDHPAYAVLILDASATPPRFSSPAKKVYAGDALRLCIKHADYSKRYEVQVSYSDLKPPANVLSISDLLAGGTPQPQGGSGIGFSEDSPEAKALDRITNCADERLKSGTINLANQFKLLVSKEGSSVSAQEAIKIRNEINQKWDWIGEFCKVSSLEYDIATLEQADLEKIADKQKQVEATESRKEGIALAKTLIPRVLAWSKAVQFAQKQISDVDQNVYTLASSANTEAEVVVRSAPLVMTSSGEIKTKTGREVTIALSYGPATDLARYTFQIRGLSYVRFGLSLGYSSVQSQGVTTGRNDTGSEVLRTKQDMGLTTMLLMTHYWCGADEREIQPWDRSRSCWWANLLPTVAVGLPITSINTFQHIFLGAVWQPVPAIGLVGGAHLGRVDRMRAEFSDGMALPAGNTGFRPEVDTVETVTKLGWYVGAVITDATFIKLFKDVALPKK